MKNLFKKHWLAIIFAIVVGLFMIGPHLFFIYSLGDSYGGIYQMRTDSESIYIARIQEIIDGHPLMGAVPYAEYKDRPPLLPPTLYDFIMAGASMILKISLPAVILMSKFFLPAFLFLLIYWLIFLINNKFGSGWPLKITAIAGSLTVLLAYDLTGFISKLSEIKNVSLFLLWSRPLNPITGGILLTFLMIILWKSRNDQKIIFKKILIGGILFAPIISSYFFSWGLALAIMACWAILQFIVRRKVSAYSVILMILVGFIISLPYFYLANLSSTHPDYSYAAVKMGLFHSHTPIFSLIILVIAILLFFVVIFRNGLWHDDWWRFSVALTVGGVIALNQQIITGVTVWPFHFIQYIKTFSAIILFIFIYQVIRPLIPSRVYIFLLILVILGSLLFGIFWQAAAYRNSFAFYSEREQFGDFFRWLNEKTPRDCVVLGQDDIFYTFFLWIPAFTHCNSAVNSNNHYIVPPERIFNDYLVILRMRGIKAKDIEAYINKNRDYAMDFIFGSQDNYPVSDEYRQAEYQNKVLGRIIEEYPEFLRNDFLIELKKYRVDYIVSNGPLQSGVLKSLHLSLPTQTFGKILVYKMPY